MKNILIALLAVTTLVMCLAACKMNNSDKSENSGIRSENSVTVSELEESNNGVVNDDNGIIDGRRITNETREIDGVNYTFDENGVCTNCE